MHGSITFLGGGLIFGAGSTHTISSNAGLTLSTSNPANTFRVSVSGAAVITAGNGAFFFSDLNNKLSIDVEGRSLDTVAGFPSVDYQDLYLYDASLILSVDWGDRDLCDAGGSIVLSWNGTGALGFFGTAPVTKPTVTGSKGGNAALASLLTQLATLGILTDSST